VCRFGNIHTEVTERDRNPGQLAGSKRGRALHRPGTKTNSLLVTVVRGGRSAIVRRITLRSARIGAGARAAPRLSRSGTPGPAEAPCLVCKLSSGAFEYTLLTSLTVLPQLETTCTHDARERWHCWEFCYLMLVHDPLLRCK
jgi:hypothetical protein